MDCDPYCVLEVLPEGLRHKQGAAENTKYKTVCKVCAVGGGRGRVVVVFVSPWREASRAVTVSAASLSAISMQTGEGECRRKKCLVVLVLARKKNLHHRAEHNETLLCVC